MKELTSHYPAYPKDKKWFKIENLDHFEELILQWASERNLLTGTTNLLQCPKLDEERGELLKNVILGGDIRDDIGDILVVIVQMIWRDDFNISLQEFVDSKKASYTIEVDETLTGYYYNVGYWVNCIIQDTIGGCVTKPYETLIMILHQTACIANTTLLECCEIAFNDIRDRQGKMIEGSFVKEIKQDNEENL